MEVDNKEDLVAMISVSWWWYATYKKNVLPLFNLLPPTPPKFLDR